MNVVVLIDGREAVPVRAIPLLTNWETMSPDVVARALAWDEDAIRFEGLQAFRFDDGRLAVPASWWDNVARRQLKALSHSIKAVELTHETGLQEWRRKSLEILPPGVFVWKDEFEPMHCMRYGPDGTTLLKNGAQVNEEEHQRLVALDFDPFIPDTELQRLVMDGFEVVAANDGSQKQSVEPLAANAMHSKLPLNCTIFELTQMGASHWLAMDGWSMREAALLLSGANPKRIDEFSNDPEVLKPDFESCGFVGITDRLKRAGELGVLTYPASPSDVCTWAAQKHDIPAPLRSAIAPAHAVKSAQKNSRKPMISNLEISYSYLLFERLQPRSKWRGGRITDTDVLTLDEAARMASKHAGEEITPADFLRAAARGEVLLRAIVHRSAMVQSHDGGVYCNEGLANENVVPEGSIPTLPVTACQHLAAAGRASWRTFDGFETVNGVLMRFIKATLTDDEPDFETVLADCRVLGLDIHALADEYTAPDAAQAAPQAEPKSAEGELSTAWHLMATPDELCAAFGAFTGMNKGWFTNLKDRPALRAARFQPGQGGRNHVAPLFYVYPVLQWLIDKRRKTGKPMQEATGWRMLKLHFPKIYEAYELNAPDPD